MLHPETHRCRKTQRRTCYSACGRCYIQKYTGHILLRVLYDLMPCVIDDFTKKHQHFIQHGTPPKVLYDLHSGGGDSLDLLSLRLNNSYKTSFYKKLLNDKDLFGHVRIFFKFLLFKLLKLQGSEDARSYMTLVQNMPCGLGLKETSLLFGSLCSHCTHFK